MLTQAQINEESLHFLKEAGADTPSERIFAALELEKSIVTFEPEQRLTLVRIVYRILAVEAGAIGSALRILGVDDDWTEQIAADKREFDRLNKEQSA